jgi:hypothetical protein
MDDSVPAELPAELDALTARIGAEDAHALYVWAFMRAALVHPEPKAPWDDAVARSADVRGELCALLELDDEALDAKATQAHKMMTAIAQHMTGETN